MGTTDDGNSDQSTVYLWANSPIVISVLGALFIAWIADHWERRDTAAAMQRETLVLFADSYSKYLERLPDYKARAIYIQAERARADSQATAPYSDGRSFADTLRVYELLEDKLMDLRNPYSLTAQVRAAFPESEIHNATSRLDGLIDRMDTASELKSFLYMHEEAYLEYRNLVERLGGHIYE